MVKITVLKDILLNACTKAQKVISSKNVIPILDNIKFDVKKPGALYLTSSDLETHLTTWINVELECDEDVSFCLAAKLLTDTISKLPNISIDIYVDDVTCKIITPNGEFLMPIYPSDEFPQSRVNTRCDLEMVNVSIDDFYSVVHTSLPFVSKDELRRQFTGVNIAKKDILYINSTDAHRISSNILDIASEGECNVIVPTKPLSNLRNFFKGNVDITIGDNLSIRSDNTSIQVQLIDEKYPDVLLFMPKESDTTSSFTIKKFDLTKLLNLATLYASKSTGQLIISVKEGVVLIDACDLDYNISANEKHECETTGEIRIGFNGNLLIDMIKNMVVDNIKFSMTTPEKAALITDADNLTNHRMVIMPLIINS
jgi:DNA polymerase-3 subunit beta